VNYQISQGSLSFCRPDNPFLYHKGKTFQIPADCHFSKTAGNFGRLGSWNINGWGQMAAENNKACLGGTRQALLFGKGD